MSFDDTFGIKKLDFSDVPRSNVEEVTRSGHPTTPKMKRVALATSKPVVAKVIEEALKIFESDKSDFELAEEFVDTDPVVGGNAEALAMLVQKAYRGPRIKPLVEVDGNKDKEKPKPRKIAMALEVADQLLYDMDFKGILFSAAINLFQDGDVVIRKLPNMEFQFLPRKYITALPSKYVSKVGGKLKSTWYPMFGTPKDGQKGKDTLIDTASMGSEMLMSADYYIINENTASELVIPKEEIIHIRISPYGRTVIDNMGRTCFNLWSTPPMNRLKKTLLWKANAMINDILWRDAMPPREHHKLDLSEFSPENYEGDTPEDRVAAARTAALAVINSYIEFISHTEVDVGYVTDLTTEIDVIESAQKTYADPNDLLKQLDEDIHAVSGVPRGAMRGEGGGSYASELLTSNYAGLRAEFIGDRIARPFEDYLKVYMKGAYDKTIGKKIIDRLRLKFRLILPRDVREIAQAVNLLMDSMIVDVSQILETVGLDTMSDEQFKKHLDVLKKIGETNAKGGFGGAEKKSFKSDSKSVRDKQEPDTTKVGKEMNPDKLNK